MNRDPDLAPYRDLRGRSLAGGAVFIAEGSFLVERMLASTCRPHSVVCVAEVAERFRSLAGGRCPVVVRSQRELSELCGFPFHRGVLGCAYRPEPTPVGELIAGETRRALLLVCPDLNDDANLGSILRSAAAFEAGGVILGPRSCDPYSRRALRLSMGASLLMRIARFEERGELVRSLREAGFAILCAANRSHARSIRGLEVPAKLVVVIGNESSGLEDGWLDCCDAAVRIPVSGALDSLNAGVAAGILLYALAGAANP